MKLKMMMLACMAEILISALIFTAYASEQPLKETLAFWHLDEIQTPDATGNGNFGILGGNPPPTLVEGKFGKALSFDGNNFVYVPFSSSLYTPDELTIEAWIYVVGFKDVEYNNILVICYRTGLEWTTVTRICGIALTPFRGKDGNISKAYLRGYVYTDREHFNEIMTTHPLILANKWIHVAFTRSLSTGLHLYVNGEEAETTITYGVRNPQGKIVAGTELYMGHDAKILIDEARVCDVALQPSQFITAISPKLAFSRTEVDIGPNLMTAIIIVAIVFAVAWLLRRFIQTWGLQGSKL